MEIHNSQYAPFWSCITADFDLAAPKMRANLPVLLSTYINRSKNHPLSVQIRWRNLSLDLNNASQNISEDLRILLGTSHRWNPASFDVDLVLFNEITPLIVDKISLLEKLQLKFTTLDTLPPGRQPNTSLILVDAFTSAPRLSTSLICGRSTLPFDGHMITTEQAHASLNNSRQFRLQSRLSLLLIVQSCRMSSRSCRRLITRDGSLVLASTEAGNVACGKFVARARGVSSDVLVAVQYFVLNHGGRTANRTDLQPILKLKALALECGPLDHRVARGVQRLGLKFMLPREASNIFKNLMNWLQFKEDVEPAKYLLPELEELSMGVCLQRSGPWTDSDVGEVEEQSQKN
ncbi:hypothetical protein GYMLUDRAFT_258835 [Collybiopsis luxurians FD-317 M1]|nr:hypothetical protein GYMLUDRAFT_258835 [Collybiopsis luxurians FD-317 M1]